MLSWLNINKTLVLAALCSLVSACVWSEQFSTTISNINVKSENIWYELNADIDYRLSPTAKEALQKGVKLTWDVKVKVERKGLLWNTIVYEQALSYQLKNHALLNLYSVKKTKSGETDMFSSLIGALNSMSKIRSLPVVDKQLIKSGERYHIAIKAQFNREALPVPLRPTAYTNSEWALSSHWVLWQLQK
ncbi:MAG: DUF4390 domain-containing protein [Methylococcaceae bacterium]